MRDRFKIHNAPDTIWLVYGDIEQDCNHGDCDEVTWCTAPQYEADIEYIRASEVAGDKAELAALRVEVERLQARRDRGCFVLMEMMKAYERRVRSDCQSAAELEAAPWECAEWKAAADYLRAVVVVVSIDAAMEEKP